MPTSSFRGRILWHELMTSDIDAAEAFYSKVVGWKTQPFEHDKSYRVWMMGKQGMGGLMAARVEGGESPRPQWFNYIGTDDVDATVRQAVELGGRVMRSAWDIPHVGRIAFLTDPQGAPFAVMKPSPPDAGDRDNTGLGDFSWHELLSTNSQTAFDFYSKLFGWKKTDAMDMGEMGVYQMFGLDGKTLGGMYTKAAAMPGPPFWISYANVPDSKRTAETIKANGGRIINGPMQVPGGGWIVTAIDPQGATFSVFSKPPAAPKPVAKAAAKPRAKAAAKPAASRKKAGPAKRKKASPAKRRKSSKPAARSRKSARKVVRTTRRTAAKRRPNRKRR